MKADNKAKLAITDMMRAEGYDFMTACHWADVVLSEFKASGRPRETYYCGGSKILLSQVTANKSATA